MIHTAVKSIKAENISNDYLQVIVQWEEELNQITQSYQSRLNAMTINVPPIYWQTKDGRQILISELTDNHLRSILSLPYIHNNVKYKNLLMEYIRRFPTYKVLVGTTLTPLMEVIDQYGGWDNFNHYKKYINQLMQY